MKQSEDHNSNLTVCDQVVANNLCIGCGVCAGVCPHQNLEITFNECGEYVAEKRKSGCPAKCGLCLNVCPFVADQTNEDILAGEVFSDVPQIFHTSETGFYLDSFVGYSTVGGHREKGASGGLATYVLETLLENEQVDFVACVSHVEKKDKLFEYTVVSQIEKLRQCSRSCYYPVEISGTLKHILAHEGRYAIIALPCVCKAIRLAMKVNTKLKRRIKFLLGLACGQTKNKCFAEYITAIAGGNPNNLSDFVFRLKQDDQPASNFGMKYTSSDSLGNSQQGTILWSEGVAFVWSNRYFTINACNFCDDIFAELADICFLDAWLPAYSKSPKGNSIVLVRNEALLNIIIDSVTSGRILANKLSIADVIKSQVSVLAAKRAEMKVRIEAAIKASKVVPTKRLYLCQQKLSYGEKKLALIKYLISQKTSSNWVSVDKNKSRFIEMFASVERRLSNALRLQRLSQLPVIIKRRILGK